jgi:hypothetical protein
VHAVRLGDVEALDAGRVAADPAGEQLGVVVEVPVVEGEPELAVDALERRPAFREQRHLEHG